MIIYEFKVKAKPEQYKAIDEAIKTSQFIQNKCLRHWMDNKGVSKHDLNKYCKVLAKDFKFANELNSMYVANPTTPLRQSAAESRGEERIAPTLQYLDFTTTARRKSRVKRVILSLKSIAVL
uniref:hypothetical protein n=1 Tax=Okeania sp. SIO2F4 TaxID=2607790 RepID=UPI00341DF6D9